MAKDPYKYFRVEARELLEGLTQGALDLEKGGGGADVVPRLLRSAHTLKGAARVVRQPEIAELAHRIEDALGAGGGGEATSRASGDVCLRLVDAIAARLAELGGAGEDDAARRGGRRTPPRTDDDHADTLRVDVAELDALEIAAAESAVHLDAIREGARAAIDVRRTAPALVQLSAGGPDRGADGSRVRALVADLELALERMGAGLGRGIERAEKEIAGVRDAVLRLRLVPAQSMFGPLERAARDAALATGRPISFEAAGGETRIDAHVLGAARSALMHVVRNAVAHGGEPEAVRRASRKPPALRVQILVERRGDRVAFVCSDDGGGVDVEAVRRAAVRRGTAHAAAAALDEHQVLRLILDGGLTTTGTVTEVAGRGIGLDVVRETAAALKGQVDIRSERGRGTSVELCVPVSLWSLAVIIVSTAGQSAAIPLEAVRGTLRVRPEELARTADGETVLHEGMPVVFSSLERALGERTPARDEEMVRTAVLVEAEGSVVALSVARVIGAANVMMRPLPAMLQVEPVVLGATLDARGDAQLVLDPSGLVRAARSAAAPAQDRPARRRRPVLVVDDSLTTRMLEQSILESAGYEVEVASSAEEALAAATAKPRFYGLFMVDVEMPGMDGFEFVARTRADDVLRETPAILVTSRGSTEDRKRGERVGARGYIVKGEFDQAHLLGLVRELAG